MADTPSDKTDPQETGDNLSDERVVRRRTLLNNDSSSDQNSDENPPPNLAMRLQNMWSSGWHKAKVSLLAQLPVMGPHGNELNEAELLLTGKKPMGWITVVPDKIDPFEPYARRMIAMEAKLDQAVKEGRLKAVDVVARTPSQNGGPAWENTIRHYCQPGNEKDMEAVAAYNEKAWNGQTPDPLPKKFGDYLGYRPRDQKLFESLGKYRPYLGLDGVNAVLDFSRNYAQPAYLEKMLGHPVDRQATPYEGALAGDAAKQFTLGGNYRFGRNGAPKDNVKAMEWYTHAAEGGLAIAQTEVGRHYAAGDIVPQDNAAAAKWLTLAAGQGHPAAMTSLGILYEQGAGVEKDEGKAMELFRRAAEMGDTGAHAVLGAHYAEGRGVTQDNVEAAFWYKLASRPNYGPPTGGDIAGKLTQEQTAAVDTRVSEWEAAHGSPKAMFKAQLEAGTASAELPVKPPVPVSVTPGKNPPWLGEDPFRGSLLARENWEALRAAASIARSGDAQDMLLRNSENLLGKLNPVSKLRVVAALDMLSKTPEGKLMVEQFEQSGAEMKLSVSPFANGGLFMPEYRVIDGHVETIPEYVLAPGASSQGCLLAVLAHELEHMRQAQNRNLTPLSMGKIPPPADMILHNRFIEADAQATATSIAYRLKQQGYPDMWDSITDQATGHKPAIAQAFENAVKADPAALENGYAKRAAFDTWFTAEIQPGLRVSDSYNDTGLSLTPGSEASAELIKAGAKVEPLTAEEYRRLGGQEGGVNYLDLPGTRALNDPFYSDTRFKPEQAQMLERQNQAYARLKDPGAFPEPPEDKMRPAPEPVPQTQEAKPGDPPLNGAQKLADLYIKAVGIGKSLPENVRIAADTPSALVTALPFVQKKRLDRAMQAVASVPEGAVLIAEANAGNLPINLTPNPLARGSMVSAGTSGPESNFHTDPLSMTLQGYSTEGTLTVHLAHELQHLRQINAGMYVVRDGLRSPEEQIRYGRFIEADAEATATEIAWKLKEAGKPAAWNALRDPAFAMTTDISAAYEKMAAEDPGSVSDGRAKRAAFDAWFEAKTGKGKPLTDFYNIQQMDNYPPEFRLQEMADKGGIPQPMTPEDVKRLGTLSDVNYLDLPGGRPLDDPYYGEPKFTGAATKRYMSLVDTFNKVAAPERAKTVTLQHGTSEANLKSILEDGFAPRYRSAREKVGDVLKGVMPRESDLDAKVTEVLDKSSFVNHRAHEIGDMLYTTSDPGRAMGYAVREAQSGGEMASRIYTAAGVKAPDREFNDARPVRLELEVASDGLVRTGGEVFRNIPGGGVTVDSSHEVLVKTKAEIGVKSVTFARLENGQWTFDGQPALTPEQAAKEIQPKYDRPRAFAPFDMQRREIMKQINDFATGPGVDVVMHDATYTAQTKVVDDRGNQRIVRVPDTTFVSLAEEKLGYFDGATAHYKMPYDLTPVEVHAYLDMIDVKAARQQMSRAEHEGKLGALLNEMQRLNPELKDIALDRGNAAKLTDAVRGVVNQIKPEDIRFHLSDSPRPANYETTRGPTAGLDWDFSPETIQSVSRQMEQKNAEFAARNAPKTVAAPEEPNIRLSEEDVSFLIKNKFGLRHVSSREHMNAHFETSHYGDAFPLSGAAKLVASQTLLGDREPLADFNSNDEVKDAQNERRFNKTEKNARTIRDYDELMRTKGGAIRDLLEQAIRQQVRSNLAYDSHPRESTQMMLLQNMKSPEPTRDMAYPYGKAGKQDIEPRQVAASMSLNADDLARIAKGASAEDVLTEKVFKSIRGLRTGDPSLVEDVRNYRGAPVPNAYVDLPRDFDTTGALQKWSLEAYRASLGQTGAENLGELSRKAIAENPAFVLDQTARLLESGDAKLILPAAKEWLPAAYAGAQAENPQLAQRLAANLERAGVHMEEASVSLDEARAIFAKLKNDQSVSHTASQWCGERAEVMQGRMLQEGVPAGAIGTAYIQAPPGASPSEQMQVAPPEGTKPFSFDEILKGLKPGEKSIEYGGYKFTQEVDKAGNKGIVITRPDGTPVPAPREGWAATLTDTGGTTSTFGDHVAPSVRVRTPEGVKVMVLDPSLMDGPATFAEWHARQGAPRAIALNADWKGEMRPIPTTPESAERLAASLKTTPDKLDGAIASAMDDSKAYRSMLVDAYGEYFPGSAPKPSIPVKYQEGGQPLAGDRLKAAVEADADILRPFKAFTEFRDQNYAGAGVKPVPVIAQAAMKHDAQAPTPPAPTGGEKTEIKVTAPPVEAASSTATGGASKFIPAKTSVTPKVRNAGIGGTGAGAVGLVMSVQGMHQALRTGDKVEVGVAGANLLTSTAQTTEGILKATGRVLPAIEGVGKALPVANIAVTAVDGLYQISKEDTTGHKVERGVAVGATAATGILLGTATPSAAEAGVITAGVTGVLGAGAVATGTAAVVVAAAPVVLTVAAVGAVAYAGEKVIEVRRAWEDVDNRIAEESRPQKREGYRAEDGKPSILGYKHIAVEMLRVSGDMKDENMSGKPARDKNGRILIDEIRRLDMRDPKNIAELERALDLNIRKQQEIMNASDSILPKWMRGSNSVDKYTMAQMELGDLTGARTELDMYKKDLQAYDAAHPDAPATTPAATARKTQQGPKA